MDDSILMKRLATSVTVVSCGSSSQQGQEVASELLGMVSFGGGGC
jgi:hypothetical protein